MEGEDLLWALEKFVLADTRKIRACCHAKNSRVLSREKFARHHYAMTTRLSSSIRVWMMGYFVMKGFRIFSDLVRATPSVLRTSPPEGGESPRSEFFSFVIWEIK